MFSYRPPKNNCWGHALRPRDPEKAAERLRIFFETYFEGPYVAEPDGGLNLGWKESTLPNLDWDPQLLLPENERFKKVLFLVTSMLGDRISFPLGLLIPISASDPSSYEFLKKFSQDAPFKFSAKYFKVGISAKKKGQLKYVKATDEIAARLASAVE